jgi:hypothetical protein
MRGFCETYFHRSYIELEPIAFLVFAAPTLSKLLRIGTLYDELM